MSDSFFTEAEDMSRSFDASNADRQPATPPPSPLAIGGAERLADTHLQSHGTTTSHGTTSSHGMAPSHGADDSAARRSVQHVVCPFCGTINEGIAKACKQCAMENTQATRQATRSKMGPWFVWQQRNPSAPGMNWSTLMSLVEKGRITPRSVVRGPTTGQLWRFAARVKGLSREFGTCWHCGAEVVRAARLCTACKRLQQPPLNPDALLETDTTPAAPVRHLPMTGRPRLAPPAEPVRREVPPQPRDHSRPLGTAMSGGGLGGASVTVASAAGASLTGAYLPGPMTRESFDDSSAPVVEMGNLNPPAGFELRAFQLDDPSPGAPAAKGLLRRFVLAGGFAGLVLLVTLYFTPQGHPHYIRIYQRVFSWVSSAQTDSNRPHEPEVTTHSNPRSSPKALVPQSAPVATHLLATSEVRVGPASSVADAKPAESSHLADSVAVDAGESEPKAIARAWDLRSRAINSEQRADYADAVKEYEWIEQLRLPEGVGPTDINSRLQHARELLKTQIRTNSPLSQN